MSLPDPYKILKVARTATQEALKKAYRALALKLHPDRNPGDTKALEQMKQVNAAWVEVGTPEARARFDLFNPPAPPAGRGRRAAAPASSEPPPRPAQRPATPPQPPPSPRQPSPGPRRRTQRPSATEEAWEAERRGRAAFEAAQAQRVRDYQAEQGWQRTFTEVSEEPFPWSEWHPEPAQRASVCPICAGTNPSCNWCASR
jgi:curved DNA-binding protein CbpA